jgi:copper(I)-binding protein
MKTRFALLLTSGLIFGFQAFSEIEIKDSWVRASTGPNSALYMTIVNTSPHPVKLIGSTVSECHHAELHTHVHDGEIMKMQEVDFIEIPGNGTQELKPGGHHIMLMRLHHPLEEEKTVHAKFIFENEKPIELKVPIHAAAEH